MTGQDPESRLEQASHGKQTLSALEVWELVGEDRQYESNLRLKLAQCVYQRESLWEAYSRGTLEVHAHVLLNGLPLCIQFDSMLGKRKEAGGAEVYGYRGKFPMLVGVGEIAKKARPLASLKRLKLANDCRVFFADAFQKALAPRRESLLAVLNEELGSALRTPGIMRRKDVNEIVQGRAEVVNDLACDHASPQAPRIDYHRGWPPVPGFRIFICDDALFARLDDGVDDDFEVRQVFACPFSTKMGALKFIHDANLST